MRSIFILVTYCPCTRLEEAVIISKLKDKHASTRSYGFNMLVQEYQQRIYWHVRKMVLNHDDADDLVQEIFVKIWKNIDSFREDAKLFTWIYRIATNECLTFLRKKKNRIFVPMQEVSNEVHNNAVSQHGVDGDTIQKKLQKALLTLPDKQRLVFNMKYFDELKFKEMSEITQTSEGALKASYHHAVKKIEEFINTN